MQMRRRTGTLQWDKLRKAGMLPHLARWFDHIAAVPALREAGERHGPKKPRTTAETREAAAASGRGGGGVRTLTDFRVLKGSVLEL